MYKFEPAHSKSPKSVLVYTNRARRITLCSQASMPRPNTGEPTKLRHSRASFKGAGVRHIRAVLKRLDFGTFDCCLQARCSSHPSVVLGAALRNFRLSLKSPGFVTRDTRPRALISSHPNRSQGLEFCSIRPLATDTQRNRNGTTQRHQ
jgi:hypothetical protein